MERYFKIIKLMNSSRELVENWMPVESMPKFIITNGMIGKYVSHHPWNIRIIVLEINGKSINFFESELEEIFESNTHMPGWF